MYLYHDDDDESAHLAFHAVVRMLCKVVDDLVKEDWTVNSCSNDLSNTLEKVDHCALFMKLMKRQFPLKRLDRSVSSPVGRISGVGGHSWTVVGHCVPE